MEKNKMRALVVTLAGLTLSACESVKVQYALPSPARNFEAAESQAEEHYQYFSLPKAYILVTPAAKAVVDNKPDAQQPSDANGHAARKAPPVHRRALKR
ncbi:hypothetical protein [Candidatus Burkholderia verschuerenii]|uniref:hypothetical protein n=1 Tax=Candidatus Burkholderia verschuerenii TaxID=242163 RepID=UPI00067C9B45|nr:hypothetical protein [Candidatus Burkholderia verschuerenii]